MGFLGSVIVALQCLEILAWSLFALGYPLCTSIWAMENNSYKDTRKLMAYWILLSLLGLCELALVKIIEWIPLWPCMKLAAVCWLVLPHFEHADYVYHRHIQPCLWDLRSLLIHYLCKPKGEILLTEQNFLALAERFVEVNGSEALEDLITRKSLCTKPNVEVGDMKAEQERNGAGVQSLRVKPNVEVGDLRPERNTEHEDIGARIQSLLTKTNVEVGDLKTERNLDKEENGAGIQVNHAEPSLAQTSTSTVKSATDEAKKFWTCVICQLTTSSQKNLYDHFLGKKHKAKLLETNLPAVNQTGCSSSTQSEADHGGEEVPENGNNAKWKNKKLKSNASKLEQSDLWYSFCDVNWTSGTDMADGWE